MAATSRLQRWGLALAALLLASCGPGEKPPGALAPSALGSEAVASTPLLPPEAKPSATHAPPSHRIGVRTVNGIGEFYDIQTGAKFVPRGMNYARLQHLLPGGPWHSNFDPALYDPNAVEQALARMQLDGFNTVRVFIDCCSAAGEQVGYSGGGLDKRYLAKVVDFLGRARGHDIFAILSVDLTPGEGGYNDALWPAFGPNFDGENVRYLTRGGFEAKRAYTVDFVQAMLDLEAPVDAILAYDLTNEIHFDTSKPPLSLTEGQVKTLNGKSYDMADRKAKDAMVNENLIYWIDGLREVIRTIDPSALVTASFFVPQGPVPTRQGDSRFILTDAVIHESQADFIDVHPYPRMGLNLSGFAANFGMSAEDVKPVIMGEFGASTTWYGNTGDAARSLRNWQVESCRYGFDGWLLWTWDSEEQTAFYPALAGDGEIEQILAPANRPDPCKD
ncbi:MAG TPA: hypothetical protein VIU38_05110 [Anaerolineales bacterium]